MKRFYYAIKSNLTDIIETLQTDSIICRRIKAPEDLKMEEEDVAVLLMDEYFLKRNVKKFSEFHFLTPNSTRIVLAGGKKILEKTDFLSPIVASLLRQPVNNTEVLCAVQNAFNQLEAYQKSRSLDKKLSRHTKSLQELNRIGIALSAERDINKLLETILQKSREITGADAGSLYIVETDEKTKEKRLRFKLTNNDSIKFPFKEFVMPYNAQSLSGYVAVTGRILNFDDVYLLPEGGDFKFNKSFDQSSGYRTKSMLIVPMRDHKGEILGVIQLINRKRHWTAILNSAEVVDQEVIPFDTETEELVTSLASQAAVSLENNMLYESIERLFEGFVKASVTAIEARDPTTSGHSSRVSILTVGLAEMVDKIDEGRFKDTRFSREQVKEVRYAALLHDFGKVGVREHVLVKAKKLYEWQFMTIEDRFNFVKRTIEAEHHKRKMDYLLEYGKEKYLEKLPELEQEFQEEMKLLQDYFDVVKGANEPTVLEEWGFSKLEEIANYTFLDINGNPQKLLLPDETKILSIPRGSLTVNDRLEIESHVIHTYEFLVRIPWTKDLNNIPVYAYAHHEKLDGSGYPRKRTAPEITIQTRMITISDIYDALTASDRPYKRAVPLEKALDILQYEAKAGKVDKDLLDIFIEYKVFKKSENWEKD
jgi:HD-GYP domain-containing protein (c-di-GMP phosphodiesterase class II)